MEANDRNPYQSAPMEQSDLVHNVGNIGYLSTHKQTKVVIAWNWMQVFSFSVLCGQLFYEFVYTMTMAIYFVFVSRI